jgi:hypothetical protein
MKTDHVLAFPSSEDLQYKLKNDDHASNSCTNSIILLGSITGLLCMGFYHDMAGAVQQMSSNAYNFFASGDYKNLKTWLPYVVPIGTFRYLGWTILAQSDINQGRPAKLPIEFRIGKRIKNYVKRK